MLDESCEGSGSGMRSSLPSRSNKTNVWSKFVSLVPRDRDVKGEDMLQSFLMPTVLLENSLFPQALDRYEPLAVLGVGGSSACIAVRYKRQTYCAKIMSDKLSAVDMEEEVRNHQQANDVPGILKLYTAFRDKIHQVVVMIVQLCQADLLDYMKQLGHALPSDEHSTYVFLLSMGIDLYILHRVVGLLHSDVKPDNFLVELVDGWPVAILGDLGFARRVPESGSKPKHVAGTPGYVSPEKCYGEYEGEESDMWALGITFYAALTGKLFEPTLPYSYVDFPGNVQLSKEMRILLRGMLAYDKDMRPSWELFFMSPAFSDSHFAMLAKKKPELELFIAAFLELRADVPAQRHFRKWRKQVQQFYQQRRTAVERSHMSLKPRDGVVAAAACLAAAEEAFPAKPVRHIQSAPTCSSPLSRSLPPVSEREASPATGEQLSADNAASDSRPTGTQSQSSPDTEESGDNRQSGSTLPSTFETEQNEDGSLVEPDTPLNLVPWHAGFEQPPCFDDEQPASPFDRDSWNRLSSTADTSINCSGSYGFSCDSSPVSDNGCCKDRASSHMQKLVILSESELHYSPTIVKQTDATRLRWWKRIMRVMCIPTHFDSEQL